MSSFKNFYDRKVEEINNRGQSFDQAKVMGAYPYSSRQPAAFHFWLALLERFTPEASKSEVLFEAVRSAYMDVVMPIRESMNNSVKSTTDTVYTMLFQAYAYKCGNSRSDVEQTGGFCVTDDAKSLADQFLSEFDSGSISYDELITKYQNTIINPNYEQDVQ